MKKIRHGQHGDSSIRLHELLNLRERDEGSLSLFTMVWLLPLQSAVRTADVDTFLWRAPRKLWWPNPNTSSWVTATRVATTLIYTQGYC